MIDSMAHEVHPVHVTFVVVVKGIDQLEKVLPIAPWTFLDFGSFVY